LRNRSTRGRWTHRKRQAFPDVDRFVQASVCIVPTRIVAREITPYRKASMWPSIASPPDDRPTYSTQSRACFSVSLASFTDRYRCGPVLVIRIRCSELTDGNRTGSIPALVTGATRRSKNAAPELSRMYSAIEYHETTRPVGQFLYVLQKFANAYPLPPHSSNRWRSQRGGRYSCLESHA
jgi:hypothetical protein